jgi:uncharacterized membrane protein (DUF373 family)
VKLTVKYPRIFFKASVYFSTLIRVLLNILLCIIVLALVFSVGKSGVDLWNSLHKPLEAILQQMLLDVVFIVALVEVTNTILGYLQDGRVHVRYIVDTVLIIMLNEVVTTWFTHPDFPRIGSLALIITTLAAVRISVTRWAPTYDSDK